MKWSTHRYTSGTRIPAAILISISLGAVTLISTNAARADAVLETKRSCSGELSDATLRLHVTDWNGDSREAFGQRVYDYRVRCDDGGESDGIDLFIAAERSDRYTRDGNVLKRLERTDRKQVTTREAGCEQVPKQVREALSIAEVEDICRNAGDRPICEIEMLSKSRTVTKMVEECWRAQYETRDVPVWQSFPENHAPLPRGARIVKASPAAARAPVGTSSGVAAPVASGQGSSGDTFWMFLLTALLAGGGSYYYFRNKTRDALREEVASARSQMGGERADYGESFRREGSGASGFHSSSRSDDHHNAGDDQRYREPPKQEPPPKEESDGIPRTIEEACELFNVTPDTPHEEIAKVYKSMAVVWHVDKATSEADRKLRALKMKQINAAKDLLMKR